MKAAVVTFILLACAVMAAVTINNTPERTPLLLDQPQSPAT